MFEWCDPYYVYILPIFPYFFGKTIIPSGALGNLLRRQLGAVGSKGDLKQMRGRHAPKRCICASEGNVATKTHKEKHTNTQIHTRRHPKKIAPNCSFVHPCIGYRAKEITA